MPTKKKMETVQHLTELLSSNKIIIVTDYRGLTVADITQLRRKLRPLGIEYHVVKNTLAGRAAEAVNKKELSPFLGGPVALAFAQGDEVQPAKALMGYRSAANAPLAIKGGLIDSRVLTARDIAALATMPPIETLRGRTVSMLLSPVYNLHSVLSANIRGLSNLLEARIKQLGGANVA